MAEVSSTVFFRSPFEAITNPKQLVEFVIMDIDVVYEKNRKFFPGQGQMSNRHALCDVWVVKASELGINDNPVHTKSHLGHLLKVGDYAWGYNLEDANINNENFDKLKNDKIPDVILIKKSYGDRMNRSSQRNWKLKHLNEESTDLDKTKK